MPIQAITNQATLVLIVHGWMGSPDQVENIQALVERTYGPDTVILNPELPHSSPLSSVRATAIVRHLIDLISAATNYKTFGRIVLIGYSLGAMLVRRLYLVATTKLLEQFTAEEPLAFDEPQVWAHLIERVILISAFNRGWAVSERVSWYYSLTFNCIGFLGSIVPGWLPTAFDIRLGSPFVTQTRLHWIARKQAGHAAERNEAAAVAVDDAILIQVIGTRDDLVSPFDQVDLSVDGSVRAAQPLAPDTPTLRPDERDYFLVELPDTDHKSALRLEGDAQAETRRFVLANALTMSRTELAGIAIDPALLADEIPQVDDSVQNTVFVIHGIRDDGFWTHRIASKVKQTVIGAPADHGPGFRGWTPTYGYFAMLPFLLPWVRRQKVEWFMDQYATARAQFPASDFHFVGHSNGTYLAARSLRDYPAFKLRNVLFAGSVVRCDYNWSEIFERKQAARVQNIVAANDWVVGLAPMSVEWMRVFDLGGAGYRGFDDLHGPRMNNLTFIRGAHGAGIQEVWWPSIAGFISGRTFETSGAEQQQQLTTSRNRGLEWVANKQFALPVAALVAVALPCLIPYFFHDSGARVASIVAYVAVLWFVITRL